MSFSLNAKKTRNSIVSKTSLNRQATKPAKFVMAHTSIRSKKEYVDTVRYKAYKSPHHSRSFDYGNSIKIKSQRTHYNNYSNKLRNNNNSTGSKLYSQFKLSRERLLRRRHSEFIPEKSVCRYNEKPKIALNRVKRESVMTYLNKKLKMNAKTVETMVYKGVELLNSNKVQEAIKVLSELITKYKFDKIKSVYILLAMAYNKNNQTDKAIEVLNEALKLYKNYIEAFIAKGNLLVDEKKWIEAKECFSAVIKIDKNIAASYLGLANCEYNLLRLKEADIAYSQAIHLGAIIPHEGNIKNNSLEKLNMARVKLKLKDLNAAQEIIEDILKDLPSNDCTIARVLLIKGRIMEKLNNSTEAAMNYERAANYGSIDISALAIYKLAKLHVREKDYYEAYFDIRRVRSTNRKIKIFHTLIDGVLFNCITRLSP